jgi:AraC-like DNA-binding protein
MQTMLATDLPRFSPLKTAAEDYETVRQAIAYVSEHFRAQPEAEAIAHAVGKNPRALTELFRRWCGLTPKEFLQAVTLDHARKVSARPASWKRASSSVFPAPAGCTICSWCTKPCRRANGRPAARA